LIYCQQRLHERGAAEMVLQVISASNGRLGEMVVASLDLGISLLQGGNETVQRKMLHHLQEKRDVKFFTSLSALMQLCTVLDLDAYERSIKAETLGSNAVQAEELTAKGEQTKFTIMLFRFLQLLCEGHNESFQDYLRTQAGNNTTVNIVVSTVDYLLRLQESVSDFYWYYSSKDTIDENGKEHFADAIAMAKQVFNSLTEYIQGPCQGNQVTLAHSRLWDAVVGFLHVFAQLQLKLSKDSVNSFELLSAVLDLQQDMVVMLLSMLEGNIVNGTIGRQLLDTLIESQQDVESIIRYFTMFLKLGDIIETDKFKDLDTDGKHMISKRDFQRQLEQSKSYSVEEIDYLLKCINSDFVDENDRFNYKTFVEQFHGPAEEIGFNFALLLTNLDEHMSNETRLTKFMDIGSEMLNYFESNLGRIEILGSSNKIERIYFNIQSSSLDQWEAPQIRESKRQFIFDVVVDDGGEKGKMEEFVNFCEDTIFEMQ
jgi:hypothetical protein